MDTEVEVSSAGAVPDIDEIYIGDRVVFGTVF